MSFVSAADTDTALERFAEIAYAALNEVGRHDLALAWAAFVDDDGTPYLEPFGELNAVDLALVERAEALALEVITR